MPNVYTGDPTTVAPADPTEITEPVDADALSAASVNTALEKLADFVAILRKGYAADADAQFQTTTAPTGYKLIHKLAIGGGKYNRIYHVSAGIAFTHNCEVTTGGTPFARDAAGDAFIFIYGNTGVSYSVRLAAGGSPWANGDWTVLHGIDTSGAVTSAAGMTATSGGVTATAGNVTATAGNLVATAGDPASDQARVKAKQIVAAGSAPTIDATGQPGSDNNVGDGTGAVVAGSNDMRGRITVTPGAATASGVICEVTFNKAYPSAPEVVIVPTNGAAVDLGWVPYVATTTGGFSLAGTATNKLPGGGGSHGWAYIVIG